MIHWQVRFKSLRNNRLYTASIYDDQFSGNPIHLKGAARPFETEEDFEDSMAFAREIGFEKIHVFPYSPRTGTPAAELQPQIAKAVKKERCRRMIELGDELRMDFLKR